MNLKKYIVKKWVEEININDDGSVNIKVKIPEGEAFDGKSDKILYVSNNVLTEEAIFRERIRFEEVIRP